MVSQQVSARRELLGRVLFDADDQPAEERENPIGTHGSWSTLQASLQQDRQRWLVNMRWVAILCVIVVTFVASSMGWVENSMPLYATMTLMAAYNLFFWNNLRNETEASDSRRGELTLFLPILSDLAALTMLLHWSGGIENPFALFFAFHMAIGATLLSSRLAYVLGLTSSLFWGATVLLEHHGLLSHHHLHLGGEESNSFSGAGQSHLQVAGYLTAFVLMLFGVIYFVRAAEQARWEAEERAFQREKLAISRDRMARVGEITAGVAHTVRNPLQSVIACLDLLRDSDSEEPDQEEELLSMMGEGLQRVEAVTRRLLALTRERQLNLVPKDLNALIEESLRFLSTKASAKQVDLETRLAELPPVMVDPDALGEVILNLVDNALDACSDGDRVLIETTLVPLPLRAINICVCDTGAGIPADQLGKIFAPFFTTKSVGEGSGLGLAIVREITEGHGGSVIALSTPEWGACFRIVLPIDATQGLNHGTHSVEESDIGPCC